MTLRAYYVFAAVVAIAWAVWMVRTWRILSREDDDDEEQEAARRRRALGHDTQLEQFRALHRHARKRG